MVEKIIDTFKQDVKHRIWLISDLQQSIPENAERCLSIALGDYNTLSMPCSRIWYLGDAVEGNDLNHIAEMTQMQVEKLKLLNIPVKYVLGNHDFDYFRSLTNEANKMIIPFYDNITKIDNWESIPSSDSFYFTEDMGDFMVVFLSDHGNKDGEWFTSHGTVHKNNLDYPHSIDAYRSLVELISSTSKPVITVSHYSFSGGNRPSELQDQLLPLPQNVKIHFYGHAHIGDKKWAGKDCFRKIACIDNQAISQVNVSSLEDRRGSAIRSVILEVYNNNRFGIYFRNHSEKKWEEFYLV